MLDIKITRTTAPKQKPDESTLTDRQRNLFDAIRTHIDEQGFAPSFREI